MNDTIARLAAANPVPGPARARRRTHRWAIAVVAAAVLVPAAIAVADQIGVSNQGATVPTSQVLPGQTKLDEALQEMQVGGTMQSLGTLNGVAFYIGRNANGHFCMAIDHVSDRYGKGVGCDFNDDGFPSADKRAVTFPPARQLEGVASDGVATVEFEDANGTVLDSTPVVDNLFASDAVLPQDAAVYLVSLDAAGNVLAKQKLRG
jgi:hypothetical protein